MEAKDVYRYYFMVGSKIVHKGITKDPECRGQEHPQEYPNGRMVLKGHCVTEKMAREWEVENIESK